MTYKILNISAAVDGTIFAVINASLSNGATVCALMGLLADNSNFYEMGQPMISNFIGLSSLDIAYMTVVSTVDNNVYYSDVWNLNT